MSSSKCASQYLLMQEATFSLIKKEIACLHCKCNGTAKTLSNFECASQIDIC
jgi:hypothetical protein